MGQLGDVREPVEDFIKRISALLAFDQVESLLQLAASSDSFLDRSEEGPDGGSLAIARTASAALMLHVFPTPRGPL